MILTVFIGFPLLNLLWSSEFLLYFFIHWYFIMYFRTEIAWSICHWSLANNNTSFILIAQTGENSNNNVFCVSPLYMLLVYNVRTIITRVVSVYMYIKDVMYVLVTLRRTRCEYPLCFVLQADYIWKSLSIFTYFQKLRLYLHILRANNNIAYCWTFNQVMDTYWWTNLQSLI